MNLNKLRLLLEQVGDVQIISEGGNWRIEDRDRLCDYLLAKESLSGGNIQEILKVAAWGPLLPEYHFDWLDKLCCNILLPIGGILCVIFVGWVMKKDDVCDEFTSGGSGSARLFGFSYFLLKYLAPVAVAVIFLSNFF